MRNDKCCAINNRRIKGQSLVELLVGMLVFSFVATVLLGMYSLNTTELSGFYNRGNVLSTATDAIARVGLLTRAARGIGENYGSTPPNTTTTFGPNGDFTQMLSANKPASVNPTATTQGLLAGSAFLLSNTWPSLGDPYYVDNTGNARCPAGLYGGTFPLTPAAGVQAQYGAAVPLPGQYRLGSDVLVLQLPVFVNDGGAGGIGKDPVEDPNNGPYVWPATYDGRPATSSLGTIQAVDTYVLRVMPDPLNPNTSKIMEAAFPANPGTIPNIDPVKGGNYTGHPTNCNLPTSAPLLLANGIVGPLDSSSPPQIVTFSYVEKVHNTCTTTPPDAALMLSDYAGIIMQMELLENQQGQKTSTACFKNEFYVRNNSQAQIIGAPKN